MANILFIQEWCTRACGSGCTRCLSACPAGALSFTADGRAHIDEGLCTRCGICCGTCAAFTTPKGSLDALHTKLRNIALQGEKPVLTCPENIFPGLVPADNVVVLPCLGFIPSELWTVLLAENVPLRIYADFRYCFDCEKAGTAGADAYNAALQEAIARTGKDIRFLKALPEKGKAATDARSSKRDAFEGLLSDATDIASGRRRLRQSETLRQFAISRKREKVRESLNISETSKGNSYAAGGRVTQKMTSTRRMLLEAAQQSEAVRANSVISVAVFDAKRCGSPCAQPLPCSQACAFKAIAPDATTGAVRFDWRYCEGCGLCATVCTQAAFTLNSVTLAALLD